MEACGDAPCQCFWPAGILTTSPDSDFLDRATPLLDAPGAGRDDQDLASGMRVPGRAGAGLERDGPAARVGGVDRLEQHLHTNATGEVLRGSRSDGARAAARDDYRLSLRRRRNEQTDHPEHRCSSFILALR